MEMRVSPVLGKSPKLFSVGIGVKILLKWKLMPAAFVDMSDKSNKANAYS